MIVDTHAPEEVAFRIQLNDLPLVAERAGCHHESGGIFRLRGRARRRITFRFEAGRKRGARKASVSSLRFKE